MLVLYIHVLRHEVLSTLFALETNYRKRRNYTSLSEHGRTKITRWTRSLKKKYQINKRMYPCNNNLGDEYRIFFSRWWLYSTRKQFLKTLFCLLPNTKKLQWLKSCNNIRIVRKLCLIVKAIFSTLQFFSLSLSNFGCI